MPVIAKLPEDRHFKLLNDIGLRTGVYAGVSLSVIFTTWLVIANRVPFLEPVALERNIIAAALLGLLACVPLIRFYRSSSDLLVSGLLAWGLLSVTYAILCLKFVLLEEHYSAFHIFVLGAICYLVFATISWIGTIIWRVHATSSSHTHH